MSSPRWFTLLSVTTTWPPPSVLAARANPVMLRRGEGIVAVLHSSKAPPGQDNLEFAGVRAMTRELFSTLFMNWSGRRTSGGFGYRWLAIALTLGILVRGGGALSVGQATLRSQSRYPAFTGFVRRATG